jgi:glycosyltransferase involved in cell wall biosynthesis
MDNPLISVIVPVYNVERFLPECIESICAQTYRNLEIILVDDGSPDRCNEKR